MLVAHNKTVPIEMLDFFAEDEDAMVRWSAACKRKTMERILRRLAVDPDESVRLSVARHRNTSATTLRLLEYDSWDEIRQAVRLAT